MKSEELPEWLQLEVDRIEAAERSRAVRRFFKACFHLSLAAAVWLAVLWGTAIFMRGGW